MNSNKLARDRLIAENELPNLPDMWEVERFRFLFIESKERNGVSPVGRMLSVSEYSGVVPKIYESSEQKRTEEELQNYRVVRPGQLAVNSMWLNHLGLGVSDYTGHISPAYASYNISSRLNKRYVHHLMRSKYYLNIYMRYLYGIRPNSFQIKSNDWMSIPIIIPSLKTQKEIANFLDRETSLIDQLIEKKKQLIDTINYRHDSYVNSVLNNLPLRKIKTIASAQLSNVDKHIYEEEIAVSVVHYTDVYYNDKITSQTKLPAGSVTGHEKQKFTLKGGEVLITKDSETPDDIAIPVYIESVNKNTVCGYHIAIIRSGDSLDGRFLFWALKTKKVRDYFALSAQGVTRYGIPIGKIGDCPIPYTDNLDIQAKIATDLFNRNDQNCETIEKITLSINGLKEIKTSLITEAVTGQLDIQKWQQRGMTDRRLDKIEEDMEQSKKASS